jgi:hypothetical protein
LIVELHLELVDAEFAVRFVASGKLGVEEGLSADDGVLVGLQREAKQVSVVFEGQKRRGEEEEKDAPSRSAS